MNRPSAPTTPKKKTSNAAKRITKATNSVGSRSLSARRLAATTPNAMKARPWIGVSPGAAAADPPDAGGRSPWIARGCLRVRALVEPVGAPLVANAREIREPERVRRRLADARRPVERALGLRVAPGIAGALEPAARCLLPLRLGRKPCARPTGERERLLPGEPHHRLARVGEGRVAPESGRPRGRRVEVGGVLFVGHGRCRDAERVHPHLVHGALARVPGRQAHAERARRDLHEVHAGEDSAPACTGHRGISPFTFKGVTRLSPPSLSPRLAPGKPWSTIGEIPQKHSSEQP